VKGSRAIKVKSINWSSRRQGIASTRMSRISCPAVTAETTQTASLLIAPRATTPETVTITRDEGCNRDVGPSECPGQSPMMASLTDPKSIEAAAFLVAQVTNTIEEAVGRTEGTVEAEADQAALKILGEGADDHPPQTTRDKIEASPKTNIKGQIVVVIDATLPNVGTKRALIKKSKPNMFGSHATLSL